MTIKFLPPSVLQPLDQGMIQAFKLQHRKRQYRHIMIKMDTTNKTGVTVTKCFRKAGFKHSDADPKKNVWPVVSLLSKRKY